MIANQPMRGTVHAVRINRFVVTSNSCRLFCSILLMYWWIQTLILRCAVMGTIGIIVVFFVVCAQAPECRNATDSCLHPDTTLLGVPFLDIPAKDIYPRSCLAACWFTNDCMGVTLDPLKILCHLYAENGSFGISQDLGTCLWLFQAAGVPCVRVSWIIWSSCMVIYEKDKKVDPIERKD